MKKFTGRMIIFFVGLPVVMGIIYFTFLNHFPLQLVLGAVSVLAANEFYNMMSKKAPVMKKPYVLIGSGLLPYFSYIFILLGLSIELTMWVFVVEAIILMLISIFSKTFEDSVPKIANSLLIIFYSGFLLTFISRMTIIPNSRYWIALFLIFVFMCDSCAWFFGILFGKSTKGFILASPNKSLVGFSGGIIGSICFGILFTFIFQNYISLPIWKVIILGFVTSIAGIIGDLIESVIKRCFDCKDSGNIIPGRGGFLDSIDSVIVAAPIFYITYYFLFGITQ